MCHSTQGDALGYELIGLSGRIMKPYSQVISYIIAYYFGVFPL